MYRVLQDSAGDCSAADLVAHRVGYSVLLFTVPMGLVSGILGLFSPPTWLNTVFGLYGMGLYNSSLQAVHRLSPSKAIWVIVIPSIVAGVIVLVYLSTIL